MHLVKLDYYLLKPRECMAITKRIQDDKRNNIMIKKWCRQRRYKHKPDVANRWLQMHGSIPNFVSNICRLHKLGRLGSSL